MGSGKMSTIVLRPPYFMHPSTRKLRFALLDLPVLLFVISAGLGVLPAYDRRLAWEPLAVLLGGGLLYLAVSRGAVREINTLRIARGAAILGGLAGFFFITQVGHYLPEEKVEAIARISEWIARLFPAAGSWQPFPNSMATFLEGLFFASAGLFFAEKPKGWRAAAGVSAGVMALALVLSMSRGAWLAAGLAGLVWLALYFRPARWGLAAFGLGLAALVAFVIWKQDIHALDRVPVVNRTVAPLFIRPDRLEVYQGSVALIEDAPFSGIGLGGQFAMNYARYVLLIQVPYLTYSHNLYLEAWLEQGLLGFASLLAILAALIWSAARQLRCGRDRLFEGGWVGLLAFYLHGVTDARPYVDLWCWVPFFLLLGLHAAWLLRAEAAARPRARSFALAGAGAALAAVFILTTPRMISLLNANLACLHQARAELGADYSAAEQADFDRGARFRFSRSIQADSNQRTAHLRLGLILEGDERFDAAVAELEAAYSADPGSATVQKALGLAYVWTGRLEESRALLKDVRGIVEELNHWGWWWGTQNRVTQAANAYRVSLLLDSNQPAIQQALDSLPVPAQP